MDSAILFNCIITACGKLMHASIGTRSPFAVQGFFAFRIWALSNRIYIPFLIWVLSFVRLLGGAVSFGAALHTDSMVSNDMRLRWLIKAVWSVGVATDVTTTMA